MAEKPTSVGHPHIDYPHINEGRLWDNLVELGSIGRGRHGVSRLAFTKEDLQGRRWFMKKMEEAGLEARMDEVGNVFGRVPKGAESLDGGTEKSGAEKEGPTGSIISRRLPIFTGSHLDTVPEAGMFDGALGTLAALECAVTLKEHGLLYEYPLEVVAFSNEEGSRGGPGLFGSRAFAEEITEDEWKTVKPLLKAQGFLSCQGNNCFEPQLKTLRLGDSQLKTSQLKDSQLVDSQLSDSQLTDSQLKDLPAYFLEHSLKTQKYGAYLELHIEQGGVLEQLGADIGVVQGIVGIHTFDVHFQGEANHAGTTPMDQRRDALLGACELALAVPELVRAYGSSRTVGTCGQLAVSPGGRNIIPGQATVSVEIRDLDEEIASRVTQACREKAFQIARVRGIRVDVGPVERAPGAFLDEGIQDIIEECADFLGLKSIRMPSGAGHDAAVMAKHLKTGMIFVPSAKGISHNPREWTDEGACAKGAQTLLVTIMRLHGKSF